ncbi:hypothetical protein SAY87_021614 [Trapa incisa]|uniref:TPX2 C-terminal domain-containing protein n=1 Tax=Trapa incisa TaxID=236973 RepID=A0AAN7JS98_9MYRT|nr:hypothetical protein SAY87_021614 [Trapa incisa]
MAAIQAITNNPYFSRKQTGRRQQTGLAKHKERDLKVLDSVGSGPSLCWGTVSKKGNGQGKMGESACLMMQPFSYVSGLPYFDSTEGNRNPVHSLGQSISLGKFVSDSISWEKWSVFSHNRYVEEAERYAQPGSVAQKKAFFEAHYKEMAARRAAAAAAAAAAAEQMNGASDDAQNKWGDEGETGNSASASALFCYDANDQNALAEAVQSGGPEMNKPTQKGLKKKNKVNHGEVSAHYGKKKLPVIPSKSMQHDKANKQQPLTPVKPSTPATNSRKEVYTTPRSYEKPTLSDKRRTTPKQVFPSSTKSSGSIIKATAPLATPKIGSLRGGRTSSASRNCMTPTAAPSNGTSRNLLGTPQSNITPYVRLAAESRSAGPKWQSVAKDYPKLTIACKSKSQSPSVSTPFKLRTIERAARRKEKLEEKFNADEAQKVQQHADMEKAEIEVKKYRETLCFKARPLPSFYKDKAAHNKQTTKAPLVWPHSGRSPKLAAIQRVEESLPATQRPNKSNQSKKVEGKCYPAATDSRTSRSYRTTAKSEPSSVQRMCL